MQHHSYQSLLQRVSVSILTLPNSRLPLSGGLAWMFPMVLAAHCPLGHHVITSKRAGDVFSHHNKLHDVLAESCQQAHLGVQVEMGSHVTPNHSHTHPAHLLVPNLVLVKPAAFDLSVTSLLNPTIILEVIVTTGAAARTTEQRNCLGSWWGNHLELGFNIINSTYA